MPVLAYMQHVSVPACNPGCQFVRMLPEARQMLLCFKVYVVVTNMWVRMLEL